MKKGEKMEGIHNSKWEYYALLGDVFIRVQDHNKYEYLSGTKYCLQWKTITSNIEEIARDLPANSLHLKTEKDAKELYLKCITKKD